MLSDLTPFDLGDDADNSHEDDSDIHQNQDGLSLDEDMGMNGMGADSQDHGPLQSDLSEFDVYEPVPSFDDWLEATSGSPVEDAEVWHEQTTPFTCGIVSCEMVMRTFGLDISEAELVFEATSNGLLTETGMSLDGIQTLLEKHGIETHVDTGDIEDLRRELDQGHKVILGLDSGELWGSDSAWEDWVGQRADHAVVLTGINTDGIPPVVMLNDPGHPDGSGLTVDLDVFLDAWKDSGNQFIATDVVPFA